MGMAPYIAGCSRQSPVAPRPHAYSAQTGDASADSASPPAEQEAPQALPVAMPDAAEARLLASSAFMRLASAIKSKDFAPLYQTMAPSFRSGVSLQRVVDGFRPFTDNGVDLTGVETKSLVVAPPPYVDEHGVLTIKGIQPTPTQRWNFEFGFLPVPQGWALTAMSLSSTAE